MIEEKETSNNSKYEMMVILLPDLGEDATKKELDEIRKLITSNGGEIFHEDLWGVRNLAYRIKKQEKGYYAVLNFSLDPSKVKELEKPLNISQKVLRYMVIKTAERYEIKTLEQYEKEAKEMEAEMQKEEEGKKKSQPKPKVKKEDPKVERKKKEEEPKVEKAEEAKEIKEEREEPTKEPKKEEKSKESTLSELDEKLKSIIDDPDITL